jgi:hypothetical protein
MRTLVGVAFDLYCKTCKRDSVAIVQDDESPMVYAELECCGRTVEAFSVDIAELLVDCGV